MSYEKPDKPKPATLSFNEVMEHISEIARYGDGADKFRALKFIAAQNSETAVLPEPLTAAEVQERLARMMHPAGVANTQIAYRKAFPKTQKPLGSEFPKIEISDLDPFTKSDLPKTLKALYKQFPHIKRGGFPKGFPRNEGLEVQAIWCQKKALEMLRDREQARLEALSPIAAAPEQKPDA